MIGVSEYDLRLDVVAQLACMYPFHSRACAYGHENGGLYGAVVGYDDPGACVCAGSGCFQLEFHAAKLRKLRDMSAHGHLHRASAGGYYIDAACNVDAECRCGGLHECEGASVDGVHCHMVACVEAVD